MWRQKYLIFGKKKIQLAVSTVSIQMSRNGEFYKGVNLLNRAAFSLGIKANNGLDVFFSPTFNLLLREPSAQNLEEATFEIAPFDFSQKNRSSITDMHNILKRIIFPLKFDKDKTFNLNVEDYDFLRYWMSRFTYEDIGDKFKTEKK